MKLKTSHYNLWIMIMGLLCLPVVLLAEEALSHVRVVRLSYVSGTVGVKRGGSTEWAKAMVNTPIQEGFTLSTSASSYVEVEFENGSTARLGELSKLDFRQLAIDSEGNKLNQLNFEQGYATFHFMPEHQDAHTVQIADAKITPNGKSEFRTDFNQGRMRVQVFNGSVEVAGPSGSARLGKDKVLEYNKGTAEAFNIHQGFEKDSWDKWALARDTQSQLALKEQTFRLPRSMYGWADLDMYGDWAYIPGFGYGWAPYAPAGWAPYSMGLWSWYSGFGWTWISGEPWGWLPYHYGAWNFSPGFGWFWMPGSFGLWSPALVTWYSGPGWIGWAPSGVRTQAGGNGVTAVSTAVVQNGQPVNSQDVIRVRPGPGTVVNRPPSQPTAQAMLSGVPLAQDAVLRGRGLSGSQTFVAAGAATTGNAGAPVTRTRIEAAAASHTSTSGVALVRSTPAPATVVMGGDPKIESAFLAGRHSFWSHLSGSAQQPLRPRLGTTLGGQFPVAGGMGQASPGAFRGTRGNQMGRGMNEPGMSGSARGFSRPGPTVLPHGSSAGATHGGGAMMRGGFEGGARSGGGFSSGTSGHVSTSVSGGGHSSSSSGGHH